MAIGQKRLCRWTLSQCMNQVGLIPPNVVFCSVVYLVPNLYMPIDTLKIRLHAHFFIIKLVLKEKMILSFYRWKNWVKEIKDFHKQKLSYIGCLCTKFELLEGIKSLLHVNFWKTTMISVNVIYNIHIVIYVIYVIYNSYC